MTTNSDISTLDSVYTDSKYTCYRVTNDITAWFGNSGAGNRLYLGKEVSADDDGRRMTARRSGVVLHKDELRDLRKIIENGSLGTSAYEIRSGYYMQRSFYLGPGRYVTIGENKKHGLTISFWKGDDAIEIEFTIFQNLLKIMNIDFKEVTENDYVWDESLPSFRRGELKPLI